MPDPKTLIVKGLPVPPSIMLARAAQNPDLGLAFDRVEFSVWQSSAQMREDLTQGRVDLCVIPTNVAAGRYNQGLSIKMLGVTLWGILHVLTGQNALKHWSDLKGKTVAIPFKGNMPDTIFRFLAVKNGLDPDRDLTILYQTSYVDAKNALLNGEALAACLPEPMASSAVFNSVRLKKEVFRLLDLQHEWAMFTGKKPRYSQAGPVVRSKLLEDRPETAALLISALDEALAWMKNDSLMAAQMGAAFLGGLPVEVITQALSTMELKAGWFPEAIPDMEFFLKTLLDLDPDLVPGGLPPRDFYYQTAASNP